MGKRPHHHHDHHYYYDDDDGVVYGGKHYNGGYYAARPSPPPPVPEKQWTPWLVTSIFIVDVALFVYMMYVNDCPVTYEFPDKCLLREYLGRFSFLPLQINPLLGPSTITLQKLGGLKLELVQHGEAWRLFSCIWLHAGAFHLLSNMLSLLFTGISLEKEFGFLKIGPLYVLSGIGGSLLSCLHILFSKGSVSYVSVGASGSLFGLLGAMLSEFIINWSIYMNKCAALSSLLLVIALNLAFGLIPGVDSSAHIGGFISGFLLGFVLLMRPQYGYVSSRYLLQGYHGENKKSKYKCYQYLLFVTAIILLIFGYAYGFTKLLAPEAVKMWDDKMLKNLQ